MKILVISHNVFSMTSNMGKTLASFFKDMPCEDIAQFYFHTEVPTMDMCKDYFRVTDFDVLKKKKSKIGTRLGEKDIRLGFASERVDEGIEAKVYQFGRRRSPYIYVGRNFLWGLNKWKNDSLKAWLDEVNPDVIFFASGDYTFIYKIAMWVADYKKIPIVTYVCDDYYLLKRKSISPLYYINRIDYKRTMRRLFAKHKNTVMICDELSQDYKKEFDINPTTIMTASDLTMQKADTKNGDKFKISYIGNLGYNRQLALVEIGKTLKELFGGEILIDLYSTEKRPQIVKYLTKENGIAFHGGISAEKVKMVIAETDILLHVEHIDEVNRKRVRHSVSTKIADSLMSGKCLFAYGPQEIASMRHLIKNECAIVATSKDGLSSALKMAVRDGALREKVIKNALETAKRCHNSETNSQLLREVLKKAVEINNQ